MTRYTGGGGLTALRLPKAYRHSMQRFSTSDLAVAANHRGAVDTGAKRNLGLLLAPLMGWQTLLFLDDDVRGIGPGALRRMVSAVSGRHARWRAAGCAFPERNAGDSRALTGDNSVVCHAHRLAGGTQDTFIGGGALAVRTSGGRWPFFPDIYNEDWLFLFGLMLWQKLREPVALVGELRQLPKNPFESTAFAASQEFGDVLAEGMARILDMNLSRRGAMSVGYWRDVHGMRMRFIDSVSRRLAADDHPRRREVEEALETAREVLKSIKPDDLAEYVRRWRADLASWHARQSALRPVSSMAGALARLDLDEFVVTHTPQR